MRRALFVLLGLGIVLSAIGYPFTGFTSYSDGYWFVWPYIGLTVSCAVAAAAGLKWSAFQRRALWIAESSCFLLPFASWLAISLWPGGDDGPGLGWLFIVIPASMVGGATALVIALVVLVNRSRSKHAVV